MRLLYFIVLALLFCGVFGAYMPSTPQARVDPARVVLVYDSSCTIDEDQNGVQDSLQLAQFYSSVRGVPSSNLYGLDGSQVNWETGEFADFVTNTLVPFNSFLESLGYFSVDTICTFWPLPVNAPLGYNSFRNEYYIPLSFDLQLALVKAIVVSDSVKWLNLGPTNPYQDVSPAFWDQRPRYNHNIDNLYPGYFPTYAQWGINSTADYYMVTRIDGPGGLAQKMNLVGNAMYADKYVNTDAFWGTTYVDTYGGNPDYNYITGLSSTYGGIVYNATDGSCADGTVCDASIALGGKFIKDLGLPFKWELTDKMIGDEGAVWTDNSQPALSAPNAMFCFGWYAFQAPRVVFDFLPGSYYSDHDSASLGATRIRDPSFGTTGGQALYHGVTTTVGTLNEPGTSGHCRVYTPAIYMLRGYSWAEAANLACNSAYQLIIGDPLYQPFADKELVVDTDAPQLEDTPTVFFANKSGGVVVFNLKGVESAKLTLRYGVVSVFEHTEESMYYMKYFRQPFYYLRGSTAYKYRLDLVDPAGNKFVSDVYTFTTPAQTPFIGTPEVIPGEILINHFDYGGSGITYRDLTGVPYGSNGNRPECDLQVAYCDDNFVFRTYDDEYMKYTIHADKSGVYSFELMYATDGYSNNDMEVLTYLDGHLITDRHAVLPSGASMGNYQMVGSMTVGAGDHVLMLRFNYTGNQNLIIADWSNAGQFYRMRFTLVNELTDNSAPTAVVVSSDDTGDYYVENVQFGDDIGIAYVKVEINNGEEVINVYELPDGLLFPFHFSAYDVSSVTITAYDAAGQSSTPITKSYDIRTRPIAPILIAPPSVTSTPGYDAPGVIRTPDGKQVVAFATRNHFNTTALFVLLLLFSL